MNTVEQLIYEIKENRSKLNQATSFDEISETWKKIKSSHEKCSNTIEEISKELIKLDADNINSTESTNVETVDLKFSAALEEMQKIAETIKTASISQMPEHIKRIKELKTFCFTKLEEEKIKMEEIK